MTRVKISSIVDCDPGVLHIGMPVEVTFDEATPDATLPKFRPARKTEKD